MENPWNLKMSVNFDKKYKNIFKKWYKNVQKVSKSKRPDYVNKNPLNKEARDYIANFYYKGYGYRIISRCLDISYTQCRNVLNTYLGIKTRKGLNVVTEPVKKFRKERVSGEKSPWYKWPEKKPFLSKYSETGLQGYYIADNGHPVWLRSSWEYIFVKWLDKNNIYWDVSHKSFDIEWNESYLPDFIIFQNNESLFVEIKGTRYKHRLYKVESLRRIYPQYKISVIDDIIPFIPKNSCYEKEKEEWRSKKLLKGEL